MSVTSPVCQPVAPERAHTQRARAQGRERTVLHAEQATVSQDSRRLRAAMAIAVPCCSTPIRACA
eukprot:14763484-Alexandrium_andersonii.AAC.1